MQQRLYPGRVGTGEKQMERKVNPYNHTSISRTIYARSYLEAILESLEAPLRCYRWRDDCGLLVVRPGLQQNPFGESAVKIPAFAHKGYVCSITMNVDNVRKQH